MGSLPETYVPGFHNEEAVRKMKYNKLGNTGLSVSQLSLGTGGFSFLYGKYDLEECKQTLQEALKNGINYIDTAPWYGQGVSEEVLGQCLEGIPRKAYYIATKVGRYELDPKKMFDFSASRVKESIAISLKKLGLEYVDVIQVHDIEFAPSLDIIIKETLPALREAVTLGQARFVGITGYPISVLADCLSKSHTKIDTVLAYTRLSLLDRTLEKYIPLFGAKGLGIVNAAPNCMGLLSSVGPRDWHPASQHIKDICNEAREYCCENNVELAKLALYFALQESGPHTVLVGMNTRELLRSNMDVYLNGLNTQEQLVYDHLKTNIFSKLRETHWENVELEKYRAAVKA